LVITLGTLGAYRFAVYQGHSEELTRAMVFSTLVIANIGLTLVNRSFTASVLSTMGYNNQLLRGMLILTSGLLAALLYVPMFRDFFHLASLSASQLAIAAGIGLSSVLWFEAYKWIRRVKRDRA
jgi:Ca2+-transporting ATPase